MTFFLQERKTKYRLFEVIPTWAAGVFSLSFVLTATAGLITQILEIHLHLLTGLLD